MTSKAKLLSQKKGQELMEVNGHILKLTNLDKILWPEDRLTKGDLINYYREIAPYILPHLKDRPESLHRHPDGINQESFYQKNVTPLSPPAWIETVDIRSDSDTKTTKYMLCQQESALIFMANLGCIEINPWLSNVKSPDRPDFAVIDLDPYEIDFEEVINAALAVKKVLDRAGMPSFCKTSGATGMHIYIPLGARYSYDQARGFAEIIAHLSHKLLPRSTSVERMPERRRGKVYLDFLQNREGQTLAAAYSLRPHRGAPVSTPLEWSEVKKGLRPDDHNIKTIFTRLKNKGDIFEPVLTGSYEIEGALRKLTKAA